MGAMTSFKIRVQRWRQSAARPNQAPRNRKPSRSQFLLEYLEPRFLLSDTPLAVTQFAMDASGFTAQFNQGVDATVLNLYDTEAEMLGPADVTIVGAVQGAVRGSLIVRDDRLTFVRSGGVLAPDIYTVTMRSASDGIKGADGSLLDGNGDGISGDNFVAVFEVSPAPATVIRIVDFARGPAQSINPGSGIPVSISEGIGVTDVRFSLNYDPAILKITEVRLGLGLPAGTQLQSNLTQPGTLSVHIFTAAPLTVGPLELVRLIAEVPASATYARSGVLDLNLVSVNNGLIPSIGDDGVQVVANFGDATGNQRYSSLDSARTLRVVAGLDSGFIPYSTIDPAIIADVTGNDSLSSLDGTRILQEVVGLDRPEIPDIVPVIVVSLVEDTGISDTDLITSNPAVTGSALDDGTVVRFRAGLDEMLPEDFVDVTADLQGSTFFFTRERLEQILGAPLTDGPHTLRLQATDNDGIGPIPGGSTGPAPAPAPGAPGPVFDPGAPTPIFDPGAPTPIFNPGAPNPVFNPAAPSPIPDPSTAPNTSIVEMTFTLESESAMAMAFGFSGDSETETAADGVSDAVLFNEFNPFSSTEIDLTDSSAPAGVDMTEQSEIRAEFSLQSEEEPLELNSLGNTDPAPTSSLPDVVTLESDVTLAAKDTQSAPQDYQTASIPKSADATLASTMYYLFDTVFPPRSPVPEEASETLQDNAAEGVEGAEAPAQSADGEPSRSPSLPDPSYPSTPLT